MVVLTEKIINNHHAKKIRTFIWNGIWNIMTVFFLSKNCNIHPYHFDMKSSEQHRHNRTKELNQSYPTKCKKESHTGELL